VLQNFYALTSPAKRKDIFSRLRWRSLPSKACSYEFVAALFFA